MIPANEDLCCQLVFDAHDHSRHLGHHGTNARVREMYWWPGMMKFIHAYVDGCPMCQQAKVMTHPSQPGFSPLELATQPFQHISMDFITDLSEVKGCNSILTVVDQGLTKVI